MSGDITFAVLGTGGIGRRTLEVSRYKDGLRPVAACDRHGVAIDVDGLDVEELVAAVEGTTDADEVSVDASGEDARNEERGGVLASEQGHPSDDAIQEIVDAGAEIDAVMLAVPNYEHDFVPRVADRFVGGGYSGVLVDVLKRSRVIGMLDERSADFEEAGITFVCGAGATPGFLTGAAVLAAQSFVEVHSVDIWWGVGLKSGFEDNRGTVREDIAHLEDYDIETARDLSTAEIDALVDDHDGVLEFTDMEHADDVLLERAGVCDAADVTVGGLLDVRSDEKPTTTTVSVTGTTFDGERATNTFRLDDATSMEANVNGPALGYLSRAVDRNRAGEYGVFGPADLLPAF